MCVWNGANFYIEKFSHLYLEKLKTLQEEMDKIKTGQNVQPSSEKYNEKEKKQRKDSSSNAIPVCQ